MIPILIAGAVIGLGAHMKAAADNDEAIGANYQANRIIDESRQLSIDAKKQCQNSIDKLAREKALVLQGNMKKFIHYFSKIKAVNFTEYDGEFELAIFNKDELMKMQSVANTMQKTQVNDIVGGVSGTALAIGAADLMAGGTLLGGAGLSVGGLTGGAALGAVAAPVFAITGIFSASEASANLDKALSNLSKANAYRDECETYALLASSVSERCDLFYETLHNVNITWFSKAVDQLQILVESKKTFPNFVKNIVGKKIYTREEMQTVASAAALAKMVKTLIDTNILDSKGHVTEESKKIVNEINKQISSNSNLGTLPQNPSISNYETNSKAYNTKSVNKSFQKGKIMFALAIVMGLILFYVSKIWSSNIIIEKLNEEMNNRFVNLQGNFISHNFDEMVANTSLAIKNALDKELLNSEDIALYNNFDENLFANNDNELNCYNEDNFENSNSDIMYDTEIVEEDNYNISQEIINPDLEYYYSFSMSDIEVTDKYGEYKPARTGMYLNFYRDENNEDIIEVYDEYDNLLLYDSVKQIKPNVYVPQNVEGSYCFTLSAIISYIVNMREINMYMDKKEIDFFMKDILDNEQMPRDYILPDSSNSYLEKSDLSELNRDLCKLAINEIYARHGRKFNDLCLQKHFNCKEWYEPIYEPEQFEETMLNEYEIENINLLIEYANEQGFDLNY